MKAWIIKVLFYVCGEGSMSHFSILVLIFALLWSREGLALTCRPLTVNEAFSINKVVLMGKLIKTKSVLEPDTESGFYKLKGIKRDRRVTYMNFEVLRLWKGEKVENIRFLHHSINQPLPLEKEKTYILFLSQTEDPFINTCAPYQDVGIGEGLVILNLLDELAKERLKIFIKKENDINSVTLQRLAQ